jgi:hypothetical protein
MKTLVNVITGERQDIPEIIVKVVRDRSQWKAVVELEGYGPQYERVFVNYDLAYEDAERMRGNIAVGSRGYALRQEIEVEK